MGEPLYEQVVGPVSEGRLGRPCRIYAPVGTHETLLAYLVRRLLENGANTSFVNRIAERRGAARGAGRRTRCERSRRWPPPKARSACRIRRSSLPRALFGAVARATRAASISPTRRTLRALDAAFAAHAASAVVGRAAARRRCRSATSAASGAQPGRSPRRRRPVPRRHRRRRRRRRSPRAADAAAAWAATAPEARAAHARSAAPTRSRPTSSGW